MLEVKQIATGPLAANCYVLADGGDAVVIDPGNDVEAIEAQLAERSPRVGAVLATHGHHDHIGAAARLAERHGAPFCIHPADAGLLPRLNFFRSILHSEGRVPIPKIDLPLADGVVLDFGAIAIEVIHAPGHTPGSVCLWAGEALFVGDTLVDGRLGRTDHRGGNREAIKASANGLLERFPLRARLYPGHGGPAQLADFADAIAAGRTG